ncbi:hypothetical protein [Agrobacterium sp. CG674]
MIREQFEKSKEMLSADLLQTITRHFRKMNRDFDLVDFKARNACYLDHVVSSAHFDGAEVFPIDIPLQLVKV